MSEQKLNSIPNVENTSVRPNIGNTMLSTSAVLSADKVFKQSSKSNCSSEKEYVSADVLLKLIENAVPKSERMNFTVPFEKYQNVVNALEVCESYIKNLQQI